MGKQTGFPLVDLKKGTIGISFFFLKELIILLYVDDLIFGISDKQIKKPVESLFKFLIPVKIVEDIPFLKFLL